LLNKLENLKADLILMKSALKNPRAPHSTDEQLDRMIKQVDQMIKEAEHGIKQKS
tara:strand:- start:67 stop:231 length:165 start_codon:yes stop_codon:yes gene_type:complete